MTNILELGWSCSIDDCTNFITCYYAVTYPKCKEKSFCNAPFLSLEIHTCQPSKIFGIFAENSLHFQNPSVWYQNPWFCQPTAATSKHAYKHVYELFRITDHEASDPKVLNYLLISSTARLQVLLLPTLRSPRQEPQFGLGWHLLTRETGKGVLEGSSCQELSPITTSITTSDRQLHSRKTL